MSSVYLGKRLNQHSVDFGKHVDFGKSRNLHVDFGKSRKLHSVDFGKSRNLHVDFGKRRNLHCVDLGKHLNLLSCRQLATWEREDCD